MCNCCCCSLLQYFYTGMNLHGLYVYTYIYIYICICILVHGYEGACIPTASVCTGIVRKTRHNQRTRAPLSQAPIRSSVCEVAFVRWIPARKSHVCCPTPLHECWGSCIALPRLTHVPQVEHPMPRWVELSLRWLVACGRFSGKRGFKDWGRECGDCETTCGLEVTKALTTHSSSLANDAVFNVPL